MGHDEQTRNANAPDFGAHGERIHEITGNVCSGVDGGNTDSGHHGNGHARILANGDLNT